MTGTRVIMVVIGGERHWFRRDTFFAKAHLPLARRGLLHHREDGPAIEMRNGSKAWFLHGLFVRSEAHYHDGSFVTGAPIHDLWEPSSGDIMDAIAPLLSGAEDFRGSRRNA